MGTVVHTGRRNMASPEELQQRVVQLEMLVTHLQRDIETLSTVLLDQQKQLDLFRSILDRLNDRMIRLGGPEEKFDPGLEKPPHY